MLQKYLGQGPAASLLPARGLGDEAVIRGLETLDLAGIHSKALTAALLTGSSASAGQQMIEQAKSFFSEAIVPIERTHRAAQNDNSRVSRLKSTVHRRSAAASASVRSLRRSISLRQGAEQTLRKSGTRHKILMAELQRLQKHLRDLAHTGLSNQENERRKMSLRLHDEIAQALIAIDLRLLALKQVTHANNASLKKEIANTQILVRESAKKIGRFTHEFGIRHET